MQLGFLAFYTVEYISFSPHLMALPGFAMRLLRVLAWRLIPNNLLLWHHISFDTRITRLDLARVLV